MPDLAVFKGGIVAMKNVGYDASVHLTIAIPQELGAAIVAAFGWPTTRNPIPVAVARLEGSEEQLKRLEQQPGVRRFYEMTPAEQAGILCKDPEFTEFLQTTAPYKDVEPFFAYTTEDQVRHICGVQSRADIKEGTEAHRQWRVILERFRRWQDERNRQDVDF
jgi:hypothetical protein